MRLEYLKQEKTGKGCQEKGLVSSVNKELNVDFSGGPVVKNSPANAGDTGLIPGLGRFHMLQGNEAHVSNY